jgi:hypothetical protein
VSTEPNDPTLLNPYKDHDRVAGERATAGTAHLGLVIAAVAAGVAGFILYGWWMSLLATHLGDGISGLLERCLLVLMGALGVALIGGVGWAVLQTRAVRRRLGSR